MNGQTRHRSDALEPQEGPRKSWQDREASQNQRQLGLDGVTPPAAHCPRRLPPGLNQGGTSLGFFFFLFFCFIPKERVFSYFSSYCPPFFGPLTFPNFPIRPSQPSCFSFASPTSKEDRRISGFLEARWTFLFDIPSEFN